MRTAESVVLTDWPPGPVERKVSISRSPGSTSISTSSASGSTATVAVEVWMRPWDSVLGTRWTRCVPPSYLKTEYAPSPLMAKVTSLKPPTSAGDCERTSVEKPELVGVAREHLVEVAREQRRLVAAGAGADLDDHVLVVVGVALDHREADLLAELLEPPRRIGDDAAQLGVVAVLGEQLARALEVVGELAVLGGERVRALELAVLAPDLGVALAVGDHLGVGHLPLELGVALLDLLDELLDHGPKCDAGRGRCRRTSRGAPAATAAG